MNKLDLKSKEELAVMEEGGKKLSKIKLELKKMIKPGVRAMEVEERAVELIREAGGKASFKMVPRYEWATCVNVNEGVVHGIPKRETVFRDGDVVSVDVGFYYKGFHTDTSFSVLLGKDEKKRKFLEIGERALDKAIEAVERGRRIGDVSRAMELEVRKDGHEPVRSLTGHGIGRELHEDPRVPCLSLGSEEEKVEIVDGMALAIEVMYTMGSSELSLEDDGWTISTKDGKISALFEETVTIAREATKVITA